MDHRTTGLHGRAAARRRNTNLTKDLARSGDPHSKSPLGVPAHRIGKSGIPPPRRADRSGRSTQPAEVSECVARDGTTIAHIRGPHPCPPPERPHAAQALAALACNHFLGPSIRGNDPRRRHPASTHRIGDHPPRLPYALDCSPTNSYSAFRLPLPSRIARLVIPTSRVLIFR